jgi:acyl-CoA dehydrogenase
MKLVLGEEHTMVRAAARDFVTGRSSLKRVRALRADGSFARELWGEMARLGGLGLTVPEELGGSGLGHLAQMVVLEELGRGLVPEPFIPTVLLGQTALLLGGTEAQRREHLGAIVHGERLAALAQHGRDEVQAEPEAGGFRLRGARAQVLGGATADIVIVPARTPDGVELFIVPTASAGVERRRQHLIDGRDAAEVVLAGVHVPDAARLSGGAALLGRVIDRATIGLCAEMLGGMAAAFEMTLAYLKTRVQFGVPIGTFQALQHRAAKLYVEVELARSAVMRAHVVLDAGADDEAVARAASVAKAKCSEAYLAVAHEGIQMHGGIGMTDEHDIGLYVKRARVAEMTFGDAVYHRDRFARLSGF